VEPGVSLPAVYHFIFRRISYGATRLQEVCGSRGCFEIRSPGFREGLKHVVRKMLSSKS